MKATAILERLPALKIMITTTLRTTNNGPLVENHGHFASPPTTTLDISWRVLYVALVGGTNRVDHYHHERSFCCWLPMETKRMGQRVLHHAESVRSEKAHSFSFPICHS
jgi:hypothetical protein